ncbi:MAG: hypothetical protein ABSB50_11060 [Terracidiphilus sp.]|jgi:hypothetical protein
MKLSVAKSRSSMGAWLFWGLGTYLVLEIGPFLVLGLVLKKTAVELAGPNLACVMPAAILVPLVWWLRQREEQGASSSDWHTDGA